MRRPAVLPAMLLAALALSLGHAISYTVQVVAVSDQQSALRVQGMLLDNDFPAYVVRATTPQGDIYRVRVGAFGNRTAALMYARSMPDMVGGPPLPALAEGIPLGVMPLEPRVLARLEEEEFDLLAWRESIALRSQPQSETQATYRVFHDATSESFMAWRAEPVDDAVLRLRDMSLWSSGWEEESVEVREEHRRARIAALASQFEVTSERIASLQQRPVYGPPYLVVLEMTGPTGEGTVLGVADAADAPDGYGPDTLAVGSGSIPSVPAEPLFRFDGEPPQPPESVQGDGWTAAADGEFFLLGPLDGSSSSWKAGVGIPLWGHNDHLLVIADEGLFLYRLVPR